MRSQRRLDQLIVQSRRRHKAKMERLYKNYLGKRAEDGETQDQYSGGSSEDSRRDI